MKSEKGQAAVEFALILPILILLICGVIDFGRMLYTANSLTTVCERAARYASIDYATKQDKEVIRTYINDTLIPPGIDKIETDGVTDPLDVQPIPRVSGGTVTVKITYTMTYITPFISNLLSATTKTMNFSSTCRVE